MQGECFKDHTKEGKCFDYVVTLIIGVCVGFFLQNGVTAEEVAMETENEDLLKLFAPPQVVSTGADELSSTPPAPTPTPPPPTTTPTPTPPQKDVVTPSQATPTSTEAKPPPKELPKAPNTKVLACTCTICHVYIHTP